MRLFVLLLVGAGVAFWLAPYLTKKSYSVEMCEAAVKIPLKSPSSFKVIKTTGSGELVFIEYDAANSFGALIRGSANCRFETWDEKETIQLVELSINGNAIDAQTVGVTSDFLRTTLF